MLFINLQKAVDKLTVRYIVFNALHRAHDGCRGIGCALVVANALWHNDQLNWRRMQNTLKYDGKPGHRRLQKILQGLDERTGRVDDHPADPDGLRNFPGPLALQEAGVHQEIDGVVLLPLVGQRLRQGFVKRHKNEPVVLRHWLKLVQKVRELVKWFFTEMNALGDKEECGGLFLETLGSFHAVPVSCGQVRFARDGYDVKRQKNAVGAGRRLRPRGQDFAGDQGAEEIFRKTGNFVKKKAASAVHEAAKAVSGCHCADHERHVDAIGLLGDDKRFRGAKYFFKDFGVDALGLLGRKEFLWVAVQLANDGIHFFLEDGRIVH